MWLESFKINNPGASTFIIPPPQIKIFQDCGLIRLYGCPPDFVLHVTPMNDITERMSRQGRIAQSTTSKVNRNRLFGIRRRLLPLDHAYGVQTSSDSHNIEPRGWPSYIIHIKLDGRKEGRRERYTIPSRC